MSMMENEARRLIQRLGNRTGTASVGMSTCEKTWDIF